VVSLIRAAPKRRIRFHSRHAGYRRGRFLSVAISTNSIEQPEMFLERMAHMGMSLQTVVVESIQQPGPRLRWKRRIASIARTQELPGRKSGSTPVMMPIGAEN